VTTDRAHLYESREGGRRLHLAACWCWAEHEPAPMPAAVVLSIRSTPAREPSYPEVVAARLATSGALSGPDRVRDAIARDRGEYAPSQPVTLCGPITPGDRLVPRRRWWSR
jgi:hypothetical protein